MLKPFAVTVLAAVQTRLDLLSNEIQSEKARLLQQLTLGLALVFFLGLAIVLAVGLAVVLWWEQRVLVLGAATGLCAVLAWVCGRRLRASVVDAGPVFADSLAALQEDLRQLQERTGRAPRAD